MKAVRVCRGQWCVPGIQGNWTRKQADKVERIIKRAIRSFVWTRPKPNVLALDSELGRAMTLVEGVTDLPLAVKAMTLEACDGAIYREKDRLGR